MIWFLQKRKPGTDSEQWGMFAAPEPHPLTSVVLWTVLSTGILLLIGTLFAHRWHGTMATWARSIFALIGIGAAIGFEISAPAGGIEGVARLLTLWPLALLNVILFAIWIWRDRRRKVSD